MPDRDDDTSDTGDSLPGGVSAPEDSGAQRFIAIARLSDIPPGGLRRVEVGGRLILLARVADHVYAADDDCTHTGGPLDEGELQGHVLTCPIHLARFDVRDGSVLRGPARDPLPTYPVRLEGDQVLVAVPDESLDATG
ncbi:MAG TPA: non-heme iron oxygenase ferredoxin subunit [Ktedonobacterales bacterium]|nr:non-heme iron oxygenase ferredoxin subunit [Ktedonobacterales bacterium]